MKQDKLLEVKFHSEFVATTCHGEGSQLMDPVANIAKIWAHCNLTTIFLYHHCCRKFAILWYMHTTASSHIKELTSGSGNHGLVSQ